MFSQGSLECCDGMSPEAEVVLEGWCEGNEVMGGSFGLLLMLASVLILVEVVLTVAGFGLGCTKYPFVSRTGSKESPRRLSTFNVFCDDKPGRSEDSDTISPS